MRNPNIEIRNKLRDKNPHIRKSKTQIRMKVVSEFYLFWSFEIVSNFGFRASNFCTWRAFLLAGMRCPAALCLRRRRKRKSSNRRFQKGRAFRRLWSSDFGQGRRNPDDWLKSFNDSALERHRRRSDSEQPRLAPGERPVVEMARQTVVVVGSTLWPQISARSAPPRYTTRAKARTPTVTCSTGESPGRSTSGAEYGRRRPRPRQALKPPRSTMRSLANRWAATRPSAGTWRLKLANSFSLQRSPSRPTRNCSSWSRSRRAAEQGCRPRRGGGERERQ